jgi:hypothetical protein
MGDDSLPSPLPLLFCLIRPASKEILTHKYPSPSFLLHSIFLADASTKVFAASLYVWLVRNPDCKPGRTAREKNLNKPKSLLQCLK